MLTCVRATVAMDAKDLRTEPALSERNNDGTKYSQSGGIALHCDRNKSYQDITSNSLAKVDVPSSRPCAVIGPDRVVPPITSTETYLKKGIAEPWSCMGNAYRKPPEYPHKLGNFQNPTRNISPRQTFQEDMRRIMVPPTYSSVKISEDTNYAQLPDRNNALPKNIKLNVPQEPKFCDVPYNVYPSTNEQKTVRNPEMCLSNTNPNITRTAPHGWPPGSVNIRPSRAYGAPELYQYQEYPSCAGPRPVLPRSNRTVPEDPGFMYGDPIYHQEGNIRFKPYPTVKERYPQQRYEYIGNYANPFHPPPSAFPTHKYEIQKPGPPQPYPPYHPIKYLDRAPDTVMEGYQRNPQGSYNIPYRNQIIHPNYGPVLANCPPNKIHSYPPDGHIKSVPHNKLPYDNAKAYIEYENSRGKMYPPSESYLVNDMGRVHPMKNQVIMPNYPPLNIHNIPPNSYYKKDAQQMKNYEYLQAHFRSMDPNLNIHNPMVRHPPVFSPNTLAISPTDSSTSNDTSQTLGTSQEDCGYVSQSSTASVRSMDSGIHRVPNDYLRKYYDSRYGPIIKTSSIMSKSDLNPNSHSKEKKNLNVRQFLQMWNEGDEEAEENNSKQIIMQSGPKGDHNFDKAREVISSNQEQLYVLGLVNVPSEELGKYEHIQKVSKLPENIKGYNNIELLKQFEEVIESSNMTKYNSPTQKEFQMPSKGPPLKQITSLMPPRPLSPLDVEAKISQSVIHKEVGCNFEIKPCSPKMLNVEVATPVQNILAERSIEKVSNPVMLKSPRLNNIDENIDCNIMKRQDHRLNINNESTRIPSCKMINTQFPSNSNMDSIKNTYSIQDLESNSGLCLASLPRLDNDIELNFPEVNQQFINANKVDSAALTTSIGDLPSLGVLDQSDNHSKEKINDINSLTAEKDMIKSPCIADSEKEFSKLSKYRKTKTHTTDSKENQMNYNMNAARTDSVIIKNPENTKNYVENSIFSPSFVNRQVNEIQQVPINLTSQVNNTDNMLSSPINIEPPYKSKEKDTSAEIAIDFSLNKNHSDRNVECKSTDSDTNISALTHNTIEANLAPLNNNPDKLSSLSHYEQNIQETLDDEIIPKNLELCSIANSNSVSTVQASIEDLKENTPSRENSRLEDIFIKEPCLSPLPCMKEEDSEYVDPANNAKTVADDGTKSVPIEFMATDDEISSLGANYSHNYETNIDEKTIATGNTFSESDITGGNLKNSIIEGINTNEKHIFNNDLVSNKEAIVDNDNCFIVGDITQGTESNLSKDESESKLKSDVIQDVQISTEGFSQNNTDSSDTTEMKTDTTTDLISCHGTKSQSSKKYKPKTVVPEPKGSNFDLPSISNVLSSSSNNYDSESTMQEPGNSIFDLPSPYDISRHSPNNYNFENTEHETGPNMELNSLNEVERTGSYSQNTAHISDSYTDLRSLNSTSRHSGNDDKPEITDQMTTLNVSSPEDIKILNQHDDREGELEELPDNKVEQFDLEEKHNENILLSSCKKMSLPSTTKRKRVNQDSKYLSFGSKEMYSPWIQKLIMCCEGNTVKVHKGHETYDPCISMASDAFEKDDISYSSEITHNNTINQNVDKHICESANISNNFIETLERNVDLIKECHAKAEVNTITGIECEKNENEDITEPLERHDLIEVKEEECACPNGEIKSTNLGSSTKLEDANNLIKNSESDNSGLETGVAERPLSSDEKSENGNDCKEVFDPICEKNNFNKTSENCNSQSNENEDILEELHKQLDYSNERCSPSHDQSNEHQAIVDDIFDTQPKVDKVPNNLSECNYKIAELLNTECEAKSSDQLDGHTRCEDKLSDILDKHSECSDKISDELDRLFKDDDKKADPFNRQSKISDETASSFDKHSKISDEHNQSAKESNFDNDTFATLDMLTACEEEISDISDSQSDCSDDSTTELDSQSDCVDEFLNESNKLSNSSNSKDCNTQLACDEASKHLIDHSEVTTEVLKIERQSNSSDVSEVINFQDSNIKLNNHIDGQLDCSNGKSEQLNSVSSNDAKITEQVNCKINCVDEIFQQFDSQTNCNDDTAKPLKQSNDNLTHRINNNIEDKTPINLSQSESDDEKTAKIGNSNDNIPDPLDSYEQGDELCDKMAKSFNDSDISDRLHNPSSDCDETPRKVENPFNGESDLFNNQPNCDDIISIKRDNQSNCDHEVINQLNSHAHPENEVHEIIDQQSDFTGVLSNNLDEQYNSDVILNTALDCDAEIIAQSEEIPVHLDKNSVHDECSRSDREPFGSDTSFEQWNRQSDITPTSNYSHIEVEPTTVIENEDYTCTKDQTAEHICLNNKRKSLKRSLSDSALNVYTGNINQDNEENVQFVWPYKRPKMNNVDNILAQNLCNIIQNNRRNSISSMYNQENVSFCILIDNSCIIAEEESDDQEKICYTEIPEECLEELQENCTNDEENLEASIISASEHENCEFSNSFVDVVQDENEKSLEESWVEDVACVETVISDDIAEDIEISGPSSPKDELSDNDESGVFSSSEHTDKVKYIYGGKMCNDDALFVDTLYNTPQMDVNKTLKHRRSLTSGEYYDNDSLEKILSEPNERHLSPYMPEHQEPVFMSEITSAKNSADKENVSIGTFSSLQSRLSALDDIIETGIDKGNRENIKLVQTVDETQDDTVHSCESSVDNDFAYKESDGKANYITSPEVSSTTSEEKSSTILLKITNYKGSRTSHINDVIIDSERPCCKFTEDKGYVQSLSNFPPHRPLLTKAAQKYIPPLKESMRDLKVKLSLPQHSLMKLKQLKKSKDEPKPFKQDISVPRISKKPKPKFEDVLKSIDEIQFKKHKEKVKKSKRSIPKVVIKKNENGSHYASTSNKDEFNPDLTGRKWQPWVFIEKNHFIDKMAIRKKTKAVYSHRKKTYVLAEKFQKYKSVNSSKFVISPPISACPSSGLKYTIRLKHTY